MSIKKVALVGNPNSGKTTVFNFLTGLKQKVGNYPGVTIDKKNGSFPLGNGEQISVIDLPGIYSLDTKTEDERVVTDFLNDTKSLDFPDLFIVIVDASNLERGLLLFTELYDRQLPVMLALNMIDVAEGEGMRIDPSKLSSLLGGIPIVKLNARKGVNFDELKESIVSYQTPTDWQAFISSNGSTLENDAGTREVEERLSKIKKLLKFCVKSNGEHRLVSERTFKIDRILTHPIWGYAVFLVILFMIFQAIYEFANIPMDLIDGGFAYLSSNLRGLLPPGLLTDLLVEGIIPGLGGVLVFIPQIALLFLFLNILEETGYMARVVFIMDRLMRPLGLHGKSVVPLISGIACAIPAIMSTRTIDQPKDRLITIMVTPLMSCSARLPVYALMIALVIPNTYLGGVINLQGLTLLAMYLLGVVAALVVALVFKWIINPSARSFLIMDLPLYKLPRLKNVGITLLEKVKVFVFEAGKIILAISIILWVLGSYGPGSFDGKSGESDLLLEKVELEESYIGKLGQQIEPAIRPLGYDWKIGIALITSFAAREVFVGTMATIYHVGEEFSEDDGLMSRMKLEVDPSTGRKVFDLATGLSLMVFYAFAMQCMSTVAIVKRETKSWKWPLIQLTYMTVLAYLGALVTYNLFL